MSESLLRLTSDGRHGPGDPYAVWLPPEKDWIAQNRRAISEALASLEVHLEPAEERFIGQCLGRLAMTKIMRDGSPVEWKHRMGEYLRLLKDFPADIWQDACDELALASKFFPDPSELNEALGKRLSERRIQISRLGRMLRDKPVNRPAPKGMDRGLLAWRAADRGWLEAVNEHESTEYTEYGDLPPRLNCAGFKSMPLTLTRLISQKQAEQRRNAGIPEPDAPEIREGSGL